MRLLVTGGAGFIGSNFVRYMLRTYPEVQIVNLDLLTYAGNLENLADIEADARYRFMRGDVASEADVAAAFATGPFDAVINFAAESHVDRSLHLGVDRFIRTNISGTQMLLDALRQQGSGRFLQVSTDEVYGSLGPEGRFREDTPLAPNNPYAATKAAADLLVKAAVHSHGLDAVITRCSNNFGPYQFPEKVIPLFVTNLLEGRKVPLYGDGLNVRDWIAVEDHCEALLAVLDRGSAGQVYNIGGDNERSNLELTRTILAVMGFDEQRIEHVPDRLGHDRRYAIDATKIRSELGWRPTRSAWPDALERTVRWYIDHPAWWQRVRSGAYRDYYRRQYGQSGPSPSAENPGPSGHPAADRHREQSS